jgi:hypothetical protein
VPRYERQGHGAAGVLRPAGCRVPRRVGRRPGSGDDQFKLEVFRPDPRALPPGRTLDTGTTNSTVDSLLDVDAASTAASSVSAYRRIFVAERRDEAR